MFRILTLTLGALLFAPVAVGKVSKNGWPKINGRFAMNLHSETRPLIGTRKHDKLLGGNGSDTIKGGAEGDVLWGSWNPHQPTNQVDRIWGGGGRDFIYASHGRNIIYAGPGDDVVHAHYGRGFVDCGPGHDLVYFSHQRRKAWKMVNCEQVTYHSGESTLTPNG